MKNASSIYDLLPTSPASRKQGGPGSIESLMLEILRRTAGMTKEELAKALGTNTDTIRSLISNNRMMGEWIIDRLIPGNVYWTKKKEYYITESAEEYYKWGIRQQGGYFEPLLGAPRV